MLKNYQSVLSEAVSIIKRNRLKKISTYAGKSAIDICKKENPSLYKRYKKFKDLHMEYKKKINDRYGNRARVNAKKKIR